MRGQETLIVLHARTLTFPPTHHLVIGPSTTQLFRNLSTALRPHCPPGAELVISAIDHEANIASWLTLAEDLNLAVKWWQPTGPDSSPSNPPLTPASLKPHLSEKTRLVTCTHASNILGTITPVRALADLVHQTCPHGLLCVDGVAFAPHRQIDMQALGADIYAFSWYKVFGPHVAQLFVNRRTQDTCLRSLGHFFKSGQSLEEKLGLAGASYELVSAIPDVVRYLQRQGWRAMTDHEGALQSVLLSYLRSNPRPYRIVGSPESASTVRVPVISFVAIGRSSREIVERVEAKSNFGFRWGHFYSKRLVDSIPGLDDAEGVLRVSMVHYNTLDEISAFAQVLDVEVCQYGREA